MGRLEETAVLLSGKGLGTDVWVQGWGWGTGREACYTAFIGNTAMHLPLLCVFLLSPSALTPTPFPSPPSFSLPPSPSHLLLTPLPLPPYSHPLTFTPYPQFTTPYPLPPYPLTLPPHPLPTLTPSPPLPPPHPYLYFLSKKLILVIILSHV